MTVNNIDIKELLEENYIIPESVFDRKRTKTSHFMINSVFPNSSLILTEYFINAFLNDEQYKHNIIRPIFALFKADRTDSKWDAILARIRLKPEYVLDYICGIQDNKLLMMVILQVPQKYAKDYILFKNGKYSQFSAEYKKLFNKYTHNDKAQPIESTIWRVINKSDELRKDLNKFFSISDNYEFSKEDELWGIPQAEYENYRYIKSNT